VSEPPTPPSDEYVTFRKLAQQLVVVPKQEVDEQRAAEQVKQNKRTQQRTPLS
jgi:hypothetical protein